MPLPPNVLAELQRDMARLRLVIAQIREIENTRQKRLEQQPETTPHAMVNASGTAPVTAQRPRETDRSGA